MAFENYPEKENAQIATPIANEKKENKSFKGVLIGLLVAALLGTWGYVIYEKNNRKEISVQKETLIASTSGQRDQLQKELEDAASRYDFLKTNNSRKDSTITTKDREIDEKKARIKFLLSKVDATEAELAEAKDLIKSLNGDIDGFKAQNTVLQTQKVQLAQEKVIVTNQRDRVQKRYDSSKKIIQEKDELIELGSTLHASNFNITPLIDKKNGKEVATTVAKKVDKLRISFDLEENMLAESGSKEVFVCLYAPDGTPIAVQALGSGTFDLRTGEEKTYTQKLEVTYDRDKRNTVSFDWRQNADFEIGSYKIEVYHNGMRVGEGYRTLKKGGIFG
jgi:uncharacterized protein YdhG (YjbR/CyaY superfamily)